MRSESVIVQSLWRQTRNLRLTFVVGMVVGIIIGWFMHGVISTIARLGLVAVMLIPIMVLAYVWWRSSRERQRIDQREMMIWTGQRGSDRIIRPDATVIDVDDIDDLRRPDRSRSS